MAPLALAGLVLLSPPAVARTYAPQILILQFADGHQEKVGALSPETCAAAAQAIGNGMWPVADGYGPWRPEGREPRGQRPTAARCSTGNLIEKCSQYIVGFNAPAACGGSGGSSR